MASSALKMPSLLAHSHLYQPYRRRNALPDIYSGLQAGQALEHLRDVYSSERLGMATAVAVAVAAGRQMSRSSADQVNGLWRQVESLEVGAGASAARAQCAISGY